MTTDTTEAVQAAQRLLNSRIHLSDVESRDICIVARALLSLADRDLIEEAARVCDDMLAEIKRKHDIVKSDRLVGAYAYVDEVRQTIVALRASAAPSPWCFDMEAAPKDGTPIQADIPGHGSDTIIRWTDGLVDSAGAPCGGWEMADDQEPPDSWTDGACWAVNEDGEPSIQPTRWKPLPAPPKGGK